MKHRKLLAVTGAVVVSFGAMSAAATGNLMARPPPEKPPKEKSAPDAGTPPAEKKPLEKK